MSDTPKYNELSELTNGYPWSQAGPVWESEFKKLERDLSAARAQIAAKDAEIKELRGRDEWWVAWSKRQANESGVMMAIVKRDARVAATVRAERAEAERDALRAALLAAESLRIDHHDAGKMAGLAAGRLCPSCVHDGAEDHRLAVIAKALARKHGEVAG